MAYDYLTSKNKIPKQPAEVETPNSVGTEVQQNTQMNNQLMQPNVSQSYSQPPQTTQNTVTPTVSTGDVFQRDANNQVNTQNQTNTQVQPYAQPNSQTYAQPTSLTGIAVKRATDLNDETVQSYLDDYQNGVNINDYQAQINALTAIDNYRATKGLKPIYSANILTLNNQRTKKIDNQIKDYDSEIAYAMSIGDYETAQQLGRQLQDYRKMVDYQAPEIDNVATYLEKVEYKSKWDSTIDGIVQQLLTAQFTYNPSDDEALMRAQQYSTNVVYESMNSKGILDSTMTAQMVTKTVNELIPVYQKMAKEEFYENIERLQTLASFVIKLDDRDYSRWGDEVTRQLQIYEARKQVISDEWDRVNQMGYVDNAASLLLGVAPRYFVT